MTPTAAPMFDFESRSPMPIQDGHVRAAMPQGELALSGPSPRIDRARTPVRGDLAHIALAGRCFVPHYAVPMPHRVKPQGATLRATGKPGGEALAELDPEAIFQVLDIAGGWAWGQVGEDGLVGYLPIAAVDPV